MEPIAIQSTTKIATQAIRKADTAKAGNEEAGEKGRRVMTIETATAGAPKATRKGYHDAVVKETKSSSLVDLSI